jgi:hypothetical protein
MLTLSENFSTLGHQQRKEPHMSDFTSTNLQAAILDQVVAGQFQGKRYAYTVVTDKAGYILGVAVANERGYSPIPGIKFKTRDEAKVWVNGMNEHIGVSEDTALRIVGSTMFPNAMEV